MTTSAHVPAIAPELLQGAEPGLGEATQAAGLQGNGERELWPVPVTGGHHG